MGETVPWAVDTSSHDLLCWLTSSPRAIVHCHSSATMLFHFLFVLAPLCPSVLCRSLAIPDLRSLEVLDYYNATLNARVVVPDPTQAANPKTTNLFSVGTATTPGNCLSDTSTIDAWLEESVDLHNAATSVFGFWQSSSACRYLLAAWLGIQFTKSNGGVWSVAASSQANFNTVECKCFLSPNDKDASY